MDDRTRQFILQKAQSLVRGLQELQVLLKSPNGQADGLTELQRTVFQVLATIEGGDAKSCRQIQKQLARLSGDPVTESLVRTLKTFLKKRGLGVRCSCGESAAPLWQRNAANAQGGNMRLTHTDPKSGKSLAHGCYTVFPNKVSVIERQNRRWGHRKKSN